MSYTKENEEAGQGVPPAVDSQFIDESSNQASTSQQLRDDHFIDNLAGLEPYLDQEMNLEVQPVTAEEIELKHTTVEGIELKHVTVEETSNNVENGPNNVESNKAEPPAEDENVKPAAVSEGIPQDVQDALHPVLVETDAQILNTTMCEAASDVKMEAKELPQSSNGVENDDRACQNSVDDDPPQSNKGTENDDGQNSVGDAPQSNKGIENGDNVCQNSVVDAETTAVEIKPKVSEAADSKPCDGDPMPVLEVENKADEKKAAEPVDNGNANSKNTFFLDADHCYDGNESGTEEEQSAFMKELENFFRDRSMEFKPPKFYGEGLNCLKLWRAVTRLGGYDKVTSCKLWRQVGESFKPPKTCTTVSWTFRGFYEKALLDYERHNIKGGELNVPVASHSEPMNIENQGAASGRARRYAAEQAMRGWHSQRLLGSGEVSDPVIKDRNSVSVQKREKQLKSINLLKRKKPSYMDNAVKAARSKPSKPQLDTAVVDIGPPADWVKVNVQKTKDCFEVYALVPGLLREEVRVQSDPAGRLVISGEPEHLNNPWGVTPFKKVVSLPSRIDPHQTSAVVTLHGQLFVRVPFEQSE